MRQPLLCFLVGAAVATTSAADPAGSFSSGIQPLLEEHCTECHGGAKPKAKLDLSGARSLDQLETQSALWFRVLDRVVSGEMPPKEEGTLSPETRAAFQKWVRGDFSDHLLERQRREGRSQFRRLSRTEYANTIQDLFGIRPPVLRLMPPEGRVDGYDKVRAALPFSAAATEAHMKIAEGIVSQMFDVRMSRDTHWLFAKESEQSKGHVLELPEGWRVSFNSDTTSGPLGNMKSAEGRVTGSPSAKKPGRHRLRIEAYGYQTDRPLPVGIYTGHTGAYPQILNLLKVVEIPPSQPGLVETDVYLRSSRDSDVGVTDGIRLIPLGLGVPVPKNSLASERGRDKPGLALRTVEVEELDEFLPGQKLLFEGIPPVMWPIFGSKPVPKPKPKERDDLDGLLSGGSANAGPSETAEEQRLVSEGVPVGLWPLFKGKPVSKSKSNIPREELENFLKQSLTRVGARLFRRDLTDAELLQRTTRFLRSLDTGTTLREAYTAEIVALLTAPDFLGVVEQPGKLTDFALASRLSYFLWNSTPDEELLAVARAGQLANPAMLRVQTDRLLNDPKSERFVEDFLDQWLGLWAIDNTTPDKDLYPEYDEVLKISSLMETRQSFRRMVEKNLSVRDFVAPTWALVNSRLAQHYGFPLEETMHLREVSLPGGSPFGGFWTQASVLKVTANGTSTSPIKRGVWMAERLLGRKIPPPPPVEGIEPDIRGAKTFREQLDLHRKGSCSVCHAKFDPYGFALESFDVMGQHRANYRVQDPEFEKLSPAQKAARKRWREGLPVDATGTTPDGQNFSGIAGLRLLVAAAPAELARGFVRHLLTYSTGEPASPLDEPAVAAIVKAASGEGFGVRSLVHGVVQSEVFRSK